MQFLWTYLDSYQEFRNVNFQEMRWVKHWVDTTCFLLFRTFLTPLVILCKIFNSLVCSPFIYAAYYKMADTGHDNIWKQTGSRSCTVKFLLCTYEKTKWGKSNLWSFFLMCTPSWLWVRWHHSIYWKKPIHGLQLFFAVSVRLVSP